MKIFFCLLLSLVALSASAQNALGDSLKQQLLRDWERAKSYTQEYLDAMPADKYGFRPTDSMRSFAEQMLHLATANALMSSIITGAPFPFATFNFEKSPTTQSKDSVAYYVNTSYDFVIIALKNIDTGKLGEVVTWNLPGGKRSVTRLVWFMKAFEHQTHHRNGGHPAAVR